ncbi:MAG: trimeric intracellular cation channel family protein [Streptosporangiaceae bacterium]
MSAAASTVLVDLTLGLDLAGVTANALLGGVMARERELDLFGVTVVALASGLAGGIIRDILLQQGPPRALTHPEYLLTALAAAALAFFVPPRGRLWERGYLVVDAVALGCWAATGVSITLATGLGWLAAVFLGTVTAVAGSITRDVLLREVPHVFGSGTLYATCAVLASAVGAVIIGTGHPAAGSIAATLTGAGLRLAAVRWNWRLPRRGPVS